MLNEENMEYYEEEVDEAEGSSMHQGGSSTTDASGTLDEGEVDDDYGEEDFCSKYRKQ